MKRCLYYIAMLSLITTALHASASRGKAVYAKSCLQCHISAKGMASSKTANRWRDLLIFKEQPYNPLAQIHLDSAKSDASWDYFRSGTYKEESRHLKDFLQKYSSDRGRHNSCY